MLIVNFNKKGDTVDAKAMVDASMTDVVNGLCADCIKSGAELSIVPDSEVTLEITHSVKSLREFFVRKDSNIVTGALGGILLNLPAVLLEFKDKDIYLSNTLSTDVEESLISALTDGSD